MKFTGQVRLPEIDHPGVPATLLVEDDQIEVFLEGESLGRWSLNDVHAARLVSAAFSIALADEEITFIADEPVDFAYKGVDHMAEVWARYRSMTAPRRMVAVGRSRRGTLPSRIEELREAMLHNLEVAGRGIPRLAPVLSTAVVEPISVPDRLSIPVEPSVVETEDRPVVRLPEPPVVRATPPPLDEPPQMVEPPHEVVPAIRAKLRPGAGLFARKLGVETPIEVEPESVFAPAEPETPTPASPWAEPPVFEPVEEPAPARPSVPASRPEPSPDSHRAEPPITPPRPAPAETPPPAPPPPISPPDLEPEIAAPAAAATTPAEVPELVKELLSTSSDEGEAEGARDLVVDLGQFEGGRQATEDRPPDEPKAPILTTDGSDDTTERGGLLGAVRSAFTRSKVVHEHEFVEAPGGIGIVRQICAECGYISIGVSD